MKHAAEPGIVGALSIFERSCAYCGAQFRVLAPQDPVHRHSEDYACPDCGKHYHLDAAAEPEVQLLRGRSDGRGEPYQETMF